MLVNDDQAVVAFIKPFLIRVYLISTLARACGARQMEDVVWNRRDAPVPHHILHLLRGEAARERVKIL